MAGLATPLRREISSRPAGTARSWWKWLHNRSRVGSIWVASQELGQPEEAAQAYAERSDSPDSGQAHASLDRPAAGAILRSAKEHERALQLTPDLPAAIWNLALLTERRGEIEDAEGLYSRLVKKHPEWEDAWFRLGYLRLQRNDYKGSVEAFESCLKRRSDWVGASLNLGLAQWKKGDVAAARKAFEKALAADSKSVDALRGLAGLAMERQDLDQA
jgi:tetratricopeptide (TPR) repeat protein